MKKTIANVLEEALIREMKLGIVRNKELATDIQADNEIELDDNSDEEIQKLENERLEVEARMYSEKVGYL